MRLRRSRLGQDDFKSLKVLYLIIVTLLYITLNAIQSLNNALTLCTLVLKLDYMCYTVTLHGIMYWTLSK